MVLSTNGRKIIKEIPRERILTETDGPFVQVEGEPARPAHVANAVAYLATAWKMPMEETCGIVAKNFMDLVDGNF